MWLKDEYNYNILLRMTSEHCEEMFQLIKDNITKENIKFRELIPPRQYLAASIGFLSTRKFSRVMFMRTNLPTQL